jgi:adenylylsulfate kinase-like enzyme
MNRREYLLVIIRGNSGSGKSTIASELRRCMVERGIKTALVEQDYLRRTVLKEHDIENGDNVDLVEQTVRFCLARGYAVVLEGILTFARYGAMLTRLANTCDRSAVYWLDVPFDETLRRHQTKPNAHEFGEAEMRLWWRERDLTNLLGEKLLPAESTVSASIHAILSDIGLAE